MFSVMLLKWEYYLMLLILMMGVFTCNKMSLAYKEGTKKSKNKTEKLGKKFLDKDEEKQGIFYESGAV